MIQGAVCAAVFNAQRMKKSDRWWTWKDFHPEHQTADAVSNDGDEINSRITASYQHDPGVTLEIDPTWKQETGKENNVQQSD